MPYQDLTRAVPPIFLPLGFLARLPYALVPLATLQLLHSATGSYRFAGAAAGAQSLAIAAGGITLGRLAERCDLRRIGVVAAVINAAAIGALIGSTRTGQAGMMLAAIAVGLTQPQVGPLVRVHWSYLARSRGHGRELISSALAYEAAADELSFLVGPALLGAFASLSTPLGTATPLAGGAVLLLGAAVPFALLYHQQPSHPQPNISQHGSRRATHLPVDGLPVARLAMMFCAMALMGMIFGVLQTGITAYATETGEPGMAGLLYAGLGLGSTAAGLAYVTLPQRFRLAQRYLTFTALLFVGMVILVLGEVLIPLPVAVVLAGAAVAPYMISVYALTEQLAANRVATAMTFLAAGGPVGTAAGQVLGGAVVQGHGHHAAFNLAPATAALALLLAAVVVATDRVRRGRPNP